MLFWQNWLHYILLYEPGVSCENRTDPQAVNRQQRCAVVCRSNSPHDSIHMIHSTSCHSCRWTHCMEGMRMHKGNLRLSCNRVANWLGKLSVIVIEHNSIQSNWTLLPGCMDCKGQNASFFFHSEGIDLHNLLFWRWCHTHILHWQLYHYCFCT